MARLTAEQWQAVRNVWEYDPDEPAFGVAASRASLKYGFKTPAKSSVFEKCNRESWERRGSLNGINAAAHRKADAMVDPEGNRTNLAEPNAETDLKPNAVPNPNLAQSSRVESEDKRAEVTARHRSEWAQVAVLRQEALQLRHTDVPRCLDKLRLAKLAAETTNIQQTGERKAWGMEIIIDPDQIKNMSTAQLEAVAAGRMPR